MRPRRCPGFYRDGEYDVAGFVVGIVDRTKLIDGSRIAIGDRLIGLPSAGLHTNGFSLARKILFEVAGLTAADPFDAVGSTVGEALLSEHRSYLAPLSVPLEHGWLSGMAHITGGGIPDNLPRVLPDGAAARVDRASWPVPPIFSYLQEKGNVAIEEMDRTFNMGIGMVLFVASEHVERLETHLDGCGERHFRIGEVVPGDGEIEYA